MQPVHFHFEQSSAPIYYSLQHPSTHIFSPKSRKLSSTLFELRELAHIMKVFNEELTKETNICADTIINKIAKGVNFKFFHNESDRHHVINDSKEVVTLDKNFDMIQPDYRLKEAVFASDAPFLRGCIGIYKKDEAKAYTISLSILD
jgi:hypothetical protein